MLSDRPYSELVTAEYTVANWITATVWGLPYDDPDGGWQLTTYSDGRPAAGLLSDPWLFTRFASTDANRQRERFAKLSRSLLCHDYMNRQVRVPPDVDLTSGADNPLVENPVCVSCHLSMDPVAGALAGHWGITYPGYETEWPVETWDPSAIEDYPDPVFYGTPISGLRQLGAVIADDPRFARCAVRRFYGQLHGVDEEQVPDWAEDAFLPAFLHSGLNVRALLRAMLLAPSFGATGEGREDVSGLRRATPWHLARTFEGLTGKAWETDVDVDWGFGWIGRTPVMDDITWGARELAGGADGYNRWNPLRTTDPTTVLVLRSLTAQAVPVLVADLDRAPRRPPSADRRPGRGRARDPCPARRPPAPALRRGRCGRHPGAARPVRPRRHPPRTAGAWRSSRSSRTPASSTCD